MLDEVVLTNRMRADVADDTTYIRLHVEHPARNKAARLLEALGGQQYHPAAGIVYGFSTSSARDVALHLVQVKVGWTAATAFDGRPRLPIDRSHREFSGSWGVA
jgi:hypothetical protein